MSERARDRDPRRAVYIISVVADLAGVHPQTLRMYERRGLLEPKRTAGNSRRYSEQDVDQLRRIQELTQDEGVNLAGVRRILELERELARAREHVHRLQRRVAHAERNAARAKRGVIVRLVDVRSIFDRPNA